MMTFNKRNSNFTKGVIVGRTRALLTKRCCLNLKGNGLNDFKTLYAYMHKKINAYMHHACNRYVSKSYNRNLIKVFNDFKTFIHELKSSLLLGSTKQLQYYNGLNGCVG